MVVSIISCWGFVFNKKYDDMKETIGLHDFNTMSCLFVCLSVCFSTILTTLHYFQTVGVKYELVYKRVDVDLSFWILY